MANMWEAKHVWDDIFFSLCNIIFRIRYIKNGGASAHGLGDNIKLKNCHLNERVFVVGNGPSIQKQNLKLLSNETTFFVNRGFQHEDYEIIKPKYHIFIDPKMATGEWPLSFLDEVVEKNPDVTFLLNGRWFKLPQFQNYKDKYNIYWMMQTMFIQPWQRRTVDLTKLGIGGAVVEQGILAALYMGSKNIYFTGVDGNGLCYNLVGESSHFYGSNSEDINSNFNTIVKDLAMMSNSLRRWSLIAEYCMSQGAEIINLTEGGIMDCCRRNQFQKVFNV